MSTPFTDPTSEASWQDLLDEIVLAYSERRQMCFLSEYTPEDDRDIQVLTFWTTMQDWIESYCLFYIDHVSGPLNGDADAVLYFTLETFRSAAGLHADGFRRATEWDGVNDPDWSYGQMQAGDIIGPWIFDDLQKAFSAMRWTCGIHSTATGTGAYRAGSAVYGTCESCLADAISNYNAAAWVSNDGYYYVNAYGYGLPYADQWGAGRRRLAYQTNELPAIPRTVDFYIMPIKYPTASAFEDIDSLGMIEGKYFLIATAELSSDSISISNLVGDVDTCPLDLVGWASCPAPNTLRGCAASTSLGQKPAVLKWSPTNQND